MKSEAREAMLHSSRDGETPLSAETPSPATSDKPFAEMTEEEWHRALLEEVKENFCRQARLQAEEAAKEN